VTVRNDLSRGRSIVSLILAMSHQAAFLAMGAGLDDLDGNMLCLCRQNRRCVGAIPISTRRMDVAVNPNRSYADAMRDMP
jgi:hypothetical protein